MSLFFVIESCKKENSSQLVSDSNLQKQSSVLNRISVSPNGYLVFNNRKDLKEYSDLIHSDNKQLVISQLISKGFQKKQKATSYFAKGDSDEDPYIEFFDQDGLLQVEDILIKISSDEKFFYIVKEQNLDPDVYSKFLSEFYDELKMDKINVDRLNEDFDMFALIDYTPFGINEPEFAVEEKRPCIGSTTTNYYPQPIANGDGTCQFWHQPIMHHYFLWIHTGDTEGHWVFDGNHDCD